MKNIHILPTKKPSIPSRLFYKERELIFSKDYHVFNGVNIYITSDEEIKKGDGKYPVLGCKGSVYKDCPEVWKESGDWKKIILTTDQDLIDDGVQAIDDEFLEGFVKNPGCEWVEIDIKTPDEIEIELNIHGHDIGLTEIEFKEWLENGGLLYKIIIPKEESKIKCYCGHTNYCDCNPLEELKQETLEEAAFNFTAGKSVKEIYSRMDFIKGSKFGAKWQQEQEQNNENSWFNEYQKVEDYIIKRIGDKFLEATPDKYKTASEATIALLENNWQQEQNKNLYSEEDLRKAFIAGGNSQIEEDDKYGTEYNAYMEEWFEQFKK